jgi:hypothetical protein
MEIFDIFAKILEFIFPRFGPVVGTMEQHHHYNVGNLQLLF